MGNIYLTYFVEHSCVLYTLYLHIKLKDFVIMLLNVCIVFLCIFLSELEICKDSVRNYNL